MERALQFLIKIFFLTLCAFFKARVTFIKMCCRGNRACDSDTKTRLGLLAAASLAAAILNGARRDLLRGSIPRRRL